MTRYATYIFKYIWISTFNAWFSSELSRTFMHLMHASCQFRIVYKVCEIKMCAKHLQIRRKIFLYTEQRVNNSFAQLSYLSLCVHCTTAAAAVWNGFISSTWKRCSVDGLNQQFIFMCFCLFVCRVMLSHKYISQACLHTCKPFSDADAFQVFELCWIAVINFAWISTHFVLNRCRFSFRFISILNFHLTERP